MVEVAVTLPESRPDDDEDVVWGLSTAAALWGRGERGDAIVWLRRAAEAAATAGQPARAAELGLSAVHHERIVEQLQNQPAKIELPGEAPPDAGDRPVDVGLVATHPGSHDEPLPGVHAPLRTPTARPPREEAASGSRPRAPSVPPAGPAAPLPSALPAPAPVLKPPVAASTSPHDGAVAPRASIRPPALPAVHAPTAAQPPASLARATSPSSYPGARKTAGPRVPILDPWADELTLPNLRVDPVLRPVQMDGDEVMVHMRRSLPRVLEQEDGVITSAAPLEHTLGRVARPASQPTRRWTATGEQPPGHIADASTAVVPKVAGSGRPAPQAPAPPLVPAVPPAPPAERPKAVPDPGIAPVTTVAKPRPVTVPPPSPLAGSAAPLRISAPSRPLVASPSRAPVVPPPAGSTRLLPRPALARPAEGVEGASRLPSAPQGGMATPGSAALAPTALDGVEAFADVPPETRVRLAALAKVEVLGAEDEVSAFGAALVVDGAASVCATIVDEPISRAGPGTLVPTGGTLSGAVALRVVAGGGGALVAVWDQAAIDETLHACPWVLAELVARADRLQALAGATMGPLGELDEPTRDGLLNRLIVWVARPDEAVATEDAVVALVCVGAVEVQLREETVVVRAGEVLFPRPGASGARAGAQGAILLVGDDQLASDLAAGSSPLATLFASR